MSSIVKPPAQARRENDTSSTSRLPAKQEHWMTDFARAARPQPRFLGAAVRALSLLQLAFAAVGLAVNPDFSTGTHATSDTLLGVDFNGWHAVSGFLLFAPGLIAALRHTWARWYSFAVIGILLGTAAWGLLNDRPLGLLFFPDAASDAVFHVVSATTFAAALLADARRSASRALPPGAA
jgi:hypothetical protein